MTVKLSAYKSSLYYLYLFIAMQLVPIQCGCPSLCSCVLEDNRKTVVCSDGGRIKIPVEDIDSNTHAIIVTPLDNHENNITIGRIFLKFHNLEILRITHSSIPAIGDSTFWPGRRMKVLDLSHNLIRFLHASDFNGLKNLQELDLSFNKISATPSAPFRYLVNLSRLLLAKNELKELVPRFFYPLVKLTELDLSGNALRNIDPDNLQDVGGLKILNLANCELTTIHPLLYQRFPHLEMLNLRDNAITTLAPEEYRHLKSLQFLNLDHNYITRIPDDAFNGHVFRLLSISDNNVTEISPRAFFNTSVHFMNISHNQISNVVEEVFQPLSSSTEVLDVGGNNLEVSDFLAIVKPLKTLKVIHAAQANLRELPPGTFVENFELLIMNLSRNEIEAIPEDLVDNLPKLQIVDFSHNKMTSISEMALRKLSVSPALASIKLHGNPYFCSSCEIEPLVRWINYTSFFNGSCLDSLDCVHCSHPQDMHGRLLHTVSSEEIHCGDIAFGAFRSLEYASKTGLYIAISIIIVIAIIIIFTIYVYKSHIAHYYTNEDRQMPCKVPASSNPATDSRDIENK